MQAFAKNYTMSKMNNVGTVFLQKKGNLKPIATMPYPKNNMAVLTQNSLSAFNCSPILAKLIYDSRNYCKATAPAPNPDPPKKDVPSGPNLPVLPNKEQLERYFFRTMAFIWDVTNFAYFWTKRNFNIYVVQNPTVRSYMQTLMDKMEKSKKA